VRLKEEEAAANQYDDKWEAAVELAQQGLKGTIVGLEEAIKTEEFTLSTSWLAKHMADGGGGPGVLKNPAIVAKNDGQCNPAYPHANEEEDDHMEAADVGILGCGIHQYCTESEASSLGGVCITQDNRDLQDHYILPGISSNMCDPSPEEYGTYGDCNVTHFENAAQEGMFVCTVNDDYCFSP
jgi:hypothetical protein